MRMLLLVVAQESVLQAIINQELLQQPQSGSRVNITITRMCCDYLSSCPINITNYTKTSTLIVNYHRLCCFYRNLSLLLSKPLLKVLQNLISIIQNTIISKHSLQSYPLRIFLSLKISKVYIFRLLLLFFKNTTSFFQFNSVQ